MQLSYAHGVSELPLLGQTIGDRLDEIEAKIPDNEALVSVLERRRFTYASFRAEVDRVARALLALEVQKGDRVGIWSTNCVAWVLTQFATAKIGAILVTINPAYRVHELEYALRQSECNVLISGTGFKEDEYAGMLLELIPELSTAGAGELRSGRFPHLRCSIFLGAKTPRGMRGWDEFVSQDGQV